VVSSPAKDGHNWRTNAMYLGPGRPVQPGVSIGFRGADQVAARDVTTATVSVPPTVEAGDGLVLVLSTNSGVTGVAPPGYALAGSQTAPSGTATAMTTQVFQRVADAGDAGQPVTVTLSAKAHVTLQLLAYSQTAASGPVSAVRGTADSASGASHTTPLVTVPERGWVVWVWSDKSASARSWTAPSSGAAPRSALAGTGTGDIATLVADTNAGRPAGEEPGLTATVSSASTKATMLSIVLAAAG
jgi:hypothetical protein